MCARNTVRTLAAWWRILGWVICLVLPGTPKAGLWSFLRLQPKGKISCKNVFVVELQQFSHFSYKISFLGWSVWHRSHLLQWCLRQHLWCHHISCSNNCSSPNNNNSSYNSGDQCCRTGQYMPNASVLVLKNHKSLMFEYWEELLSENNFKLIMHSLASYHILIHEVDNPVICFVTASEF